MEIGRLASQTFYANSRKTDLADLRGSRKSDAGSTGFHRIAKDQVVAKIFTSGSLAFPMLHNPVGIAAVLWVSGQFMISLVVTLDTRKLTYCASSLRQTGNSGGKLNLLIWHRLLRGHGHLQDFWYFPTGELTTLKPASEKPTSSDIRLSPRCDSKSSSLWRLLASVMPASIELDSKEDKAAKAELHGFTPEES